ncbi:MAG: RNA-binding S4 domain-containing protein [Clostridia bacterium]|nr:RNA-binding S4 domain-containing protein [Clostridia bacterium]MCL6521359.1 RNA-binding S4 domain-containing protein [Bacillota bacterium]
MRLDKWLKESRLVKRRAVAQELCRAGRAWLNGRPAKPGSEVREGDRLRLLLGGRLLEVTVLEGEPRPGNAQPVFRLEEERQPPPGEAG